MAELIAKSALDRRAPLVIASTRLAEVEPGKVTAIQPFPGQDKAVSKALKPLGFTFPTPNTFQTRADAILAWTGRDQAFLIGADCPAMPAAVTDQSGGWASLSLSGPLAVDVLARYVPMDLHIAAFPVGSAVRTPLYHMSMVLMRLSDQEFRIMVFRSMARTAWHELEVALKTLAARAL